MNPGQPNHLRTKDAPHVERFVVVRSAKAGERVVLRSLDSRAAEVAVAHRDLLIGEVVELEAAE